MDIAFIVYLVVINIIAFVAFGVDKYKAKKKMWRIPEKTLLGLALIGGALGAWCGMKFLRHKTQHNSFRILVPLFLIAWVVLIVWLFMESFTYVYTD
mgnify:CR=1 FL=1